MTPAATVLAGEAELEAIADRMAAEISADHPDGVVLVGLLKSGIIATADLARRLTVDVEVDFLALSTFRANSGRIRFLKDITTDVSGRDVVIVADLVDTGLKLGFLVGDMQRRGARSVRVSAMFDKVERRILPVAIDYVGAEVPNRFLIGYGLDYAGRYRNLSALAVADLDALREDPDVYVDQFYGSNRAFA